MDVAQKVMNVAIGVGVGVIIVVIVATILAGADVLGAAALGSFTGFVAVASLVPLVLIAGALYLAWQGIRGRDHF